LTYGIFIGFNQVQLLSTHIAVILELLQVSKMALSAERRCSMQNSFGLLWQGAGFFKNLTGLCSLHRLIVKCGAGSS